MVPDTHEAIDPSDPASRAAGPLTGALVARWAVVGLGVVLALFAVVAVGGAVISSRAADGVRDSGDIAERYLEAVDAMQREDALEISYTNEPDVAVLNEFKRADRDAVAALAALARMGAPHDVELARRALDLHAQYTAGAYGIFAAVRRGDEEEAERLDDTIADPVQGELQPLITGTGPGRAISTLNEIDDLDQAQTTALRATVTVVIVGTTAWILLLIALFVYRRRSDREALGRLIESRAQARTDDLTGLLNRRGLYADADAALDEARTTGEPVALAIVDLDRFKEINDTLGHTVGDDMLGQMGDRLRAAFSGAVALGRLGGDEFIAIFSGSGAAREALNAANRFLAGLDEPFPLEGLLVNIRASVGIATFPGDGADRAELMRHADIAMYRAKAVGAGVEIYAGGGDDHGIDRLVLASELRNALESDQIVLHYQPKADLVTGIVTSVEALVRWQHPVRGLLAPAAFLPLAEQRGLMRAMTLHVLGRALEQAAVWQAAGRPLQVAVNLSASNLIDVRFPDDVATLLRESGVPPELLQLEITEETIMTDPVRVLDVLARLGELGLAFSLDDFGTGYSSLAQLKRLPVQELKIDRSFVMHMDSDSNDAAIVRSTVDLARSLGLRVVAEGVESQSTREQLAGFGCDLMQGYHLSRALPVAELDAWLDAREAALIGARPGEAGA